MDPWLEAHWGDVHTTLITYIRDTLQSQLPGPLRARAQERVLLEYESGEERDVYPDVRVIEYPGSSTPPPTAGTAVAEPIIYHLRDDPITERNIEIIDAGSGGRVVTTIEVLSPTNKLPGPGQVQYLQKQREYREGRVNLVEIDLLRRGQRVTVLKPADIRPEHQSTYAIVAFRAGEYPQWELYRISLRQRLPAVRIPLRPGDRDAVLDLQTILDQAYRNGGYDNLDYRKDPEPPLNVDDARWADELLRSKGLRG